MDFQPQVNLPYQSPPRLQRVDESASVDPYLLIKAIDAELTSTLAEYADIMPASLIRAGKVALSGSGKVLSLPVGGLETVDIESLPRWPLFVLLSCQAALGPAHTDGWRVALPAAASVEIAMSAADLLDELADDDPSPFVREYGAGQALNTGSLMLVMAQQILLKAGGDRALLALKALQDMLIQAATGQHLDMLYEGMGVGEVNLEMSVQMTELKAGALVSGACRMGAIMSGAGQREVELLANLGKEIGSIAQLVNDIEDVLPEQAASNVDNPTDGSLPSLSAPKTDLSRRKRTLPIIFTLRDDSLHPNALQRAYMYGEPTPDEILRQTILDTGGVQFASLVIEVHRQNILEILTELETLCPGSRAILSPILPKE